MRETVLERRRPNFAQVTTSVRSYPVPTPDGFVPIQSSLPGSTFDDSDPVARREAEILDERDEELSGRGVSSTLGISGTMKWPWKVSCYKWKPSPKCSSSKVTSTVTSTAKAATSTSTSTVIISSTIYPLRQPRHQRQSRAPPPALQSQPQHQRPLKRPRPTQPLLLSMPLAQPTT